MELVDLTQPLAVGAPHMPSQPPYRMTRLREVGKDATTVSCLSMTTHTGTHIDAPVHMVEGGRFLHDFGLQELAGPVVPLHAVAGAGSAISMADLRGTELVRSGDIVFVHTGWDGLFLTGAYYDHPYLGPDVADWLVEVGCRILGIDTLGPDLPAVRRPPRFDYPVHRRLLGEGILIVENLAAVNLLGGRRHDCLIAPLRLMDVDGSPCRVIAMQEGTLDATGLRSS